MDKQYIATLSFVVVWYHTIPYTDLLHPSILTRGVIILCNKSETSFTKSPDLGHRSICICIFLTTIWHLSTGSNHVTNACNHGRDRLCHRICFSGHFGERFECKCECLYASFCHQRNCLSTRFLMSFLSSLSAV